MAKRLSCSKDRQMSKTSEVLIYLVSCMVNQEEVDPQIIASVDLSELYAMADAHQLTAVTAFALETAGVRDGRFLKERSKAVSSEVNFDRERARILKEFEEKQIWYMPLKGIILKRFYPQTGMRQMSDNDILFDAEKAEDVHEIMASLDYETEIYEEGHRDDYRKLPMFHFEMHRVLFDEKTLPESLYRYYRDVRRLLIKDSGNSFGYHLSDEDFYLYMIAHEYKHFAWGGTGLRSLLDTYVYLKKHSGTLDWEYITAESEKLGIAGFEKRNRSLALRVFHAGDIQKLSEKETELLDYFIESEAYGSMLHAIPNYSRHVGMFRYVMQRAFLPMEAVEKYYPFFYRHKLLLPILPICRVIRQRRNVILEIRLLSERK